MNKDHERYRHCMAKYCNNIVNDPVDLLVVNEPEAEASPDILSLKMPVVVTSNQKQNFLLSKSNGGHILVNLKTGATYMFISGAYDSIEKYLEVGGFYARRAEINIID